MVISEADGSVLFSFSSVLETTIVLGPGMGSVVGARAESEVPIPISTSGGEKVSVAEGFPRSSLELLMANGWFIFSFVSIVVLDEILVARVVTAGTKFEVEAMASSYGGGASHRGGK